ncbi:MAG: hypothetical protein WAO20_01025, partial [Acidobacteriota bacterium]
MKRTILLIFTLLIFAPAVAVMGESHLTVLSALRNEEARSPELDRLLIHLTDVNGPRVTGSPGFRKAAEWARETLTGWGMENSRLEDWGEFGRGWDFQKCRVEMTEPYYFPLIAYPEVWTASLQGPVEGTPVPVEINEEKDLEQYRGKLQGAIVLMPRRASAYGGYEPESGRYSEAQLKELVQAPALPSGDPQARRERYRA